jgi:NADPH:quinone reductase-like Zn-dependent oxidoreductase
MSTPTTARAVRFDTYGDRDVLRLTDIPMPEPGPGQVVVAVRATAVNPFDTMLRLGVLHELFPATFPSAQGSDLAGIVTAVAPDVESFTVGDEVLGWAPEPGAHATHVAVPATHLAAKPANLSWESAGSLHMAAATAYASIQAVAPRAGETVAISAASGGVGTIAVQLLTHRGVRVLGIASEASAPWLAKYGAIPVAYGDGLRERLVEAAGREGIDAFIDLAGPEYLDLAVELGIPAERIQTTVSMDRAAQIGAKTDGRHNAATPEVLAELVALAAAGAVEVPVTSTYPLDRVADAFAQLEGRHARGKIALVP